ncbi:MAG TPA: hypothetical protein VGK01_07305, partial [Candidatus Angelobacter sp.]
MVSLCLAPAATSAAEAEDLKQSYRRHKCVKFHDIIYRTFRHILYTLVPGKSAQSRSTAVDRGLSGSISA